MSVTRRYQVTIRRVQEQKVTFLLEGGYGGTEDGLTKIAAAHARDGSWETTSFERGDVGSEVVQITEVTS